MKHDLLIIDDWVLEPLKESAAHEVLEVIEARNRDGLLILCSQFAPSAGLDKLGNGAKANAVIDRVVCKSCTIHIEGDESMRKRMGVSRNRYRYGASYAPRFLYLRTAISSEPFACAMAVSQKLFASNAALNCAVSSKLALLNKAA